MFRNFFIRLSSSTKAIKEVLNLHLQCRPRLEIVPRNIVPLMVFRHLEPSSFIRRLLHHARIMNCQSLLECSWEVSFIGTSLSDTRVESQALDISVRSVLSLFRSINLYRRLCAIWRLLLYWKKVSDLRVIWYFLSVPVYCLLVFCSVMICFVLNAIFLCKEALFLLSLCH